MTCIIHLAYLTYLAYLASVACVAYFDVLNCIAQIGRFTCLQSSPIVLFIIPSLHRSWMATMDINLGLRHAPRRVLSTAIVFQKSLYRPS